MRPSVLAKLTRPSASGLLWRERLFEHLDHARHHPVVWVCGPAGVGKSSLVASYLETRELPCLWYQVDAGDAEPASFFHYLGRGVHAATPRKRPLPELAPEYLPNLETFVRRYVRMMFERLKSPFVLVLDNYQELPVDSALHEILATALSEVPQGSSVLIVSRDDPPPALARWYANSPAIGWDELKFTADEAKAFARHQGHKDTAALGPLTAAAEGWAAGLVLLLRAHARDADLASARGRQCLYDYFAREVFAAIPAEDRDILTKTALLPSITANAARELTGSDHAPQVLAQLHRARFFVDRRGRAAASYVYHPLFRDFLLKQCAEVYPPERLAQLKCQAASILECDSQVEAAVDLLAQAGAWGELARLVCQHGPALLSAGRHLALEGWITHVPERLLADTPWLLYWLGVSRMPFETQTSRASLEKAFALFKAREDIIGQLLTLSAELASYFVEWSDYTPVGHWLGELEMLLTRLPEFPSIDVEAQVATGMMALVMYSPQHPLLKRFTERALPLMRSCAEPQQRVSVASPAIFYCLQRGEFAEAGRILGELKAGLDLNKVSPLDAILLKVFESICAWMQCAAYDDALVLLAEAEEIARTSGVHIVDYLIYAQMSFAALGAEDLERAAQAIAQGKTVLEPSRQLLAAVSNHLEGWLALARGNLSRADLEAARWVIEETRRLHTPFPESESRLQYGQMLIEVGDHAAARGELAQARVFGEEMHSPYTQFRTLITEANSFFLASEDAAALELLRQALTIGRTHDYMNCHPGWQPRVVSRLFARALEEGIEVDYVRRFIRARRLKPPSPEVDLWPWPIRIYTLGRFSLVIDGEPLRFQGKVQKRPMELLKALVAHGGRGIEPGTLVTQLWPDLEGDAARNAYDIALHRLRKLLGREDVLTVHDGKLTLDPGQVWVDAWAFERLCSKVDRQAEPLVERGPETTSERLLRLYLGHFLGGEDWSWAIGARDRLRSKFLRSVSILGETLERHGHALQVITLYQRAIELDPLAETFHQRLILAYKAQGQVAEALSAYRRCRDVLSVTLGVEPSAPTQAVYRALKA